MYKGFVSVSKDKTQSLRNKLSKMTSVFTDCNPMNYMRDISHDVCGVGCMC